MTDSKPKSDTRRFVDAPGEVTIERASEKKPEPKKPPEPKK